VSPMHALIPCIKCIMANFIQPPLRSMERSGS
jgi:hypothetical protein